MFNISPIHTLKQGLKNCILNFIKYLLFRADSVELCAPPKILLLISLLGRLVHLTMLSGIRPGWE